jgi:hypothetical protein
MIEPLFQALRALLTRTENHFAPDANAGPDTALMDEPSRACGWFDSSHDLARGLRVQELATPEALAQELPLGSWLELELADSRR